MEWNELARNSMSYLSVSFEKVMNVDGLSWESPRLMIREGQALSLLTRGLARKPSSPEALDFNLVKVNKISADVKLQSLHLSLMITTS
jgi:hypothetical protein